MPDGKKSIAVNVTFNQWIKLYRKRFRSSKSKNNRIVKAKTGATIRS